MPAPLLSVRVKRNLFEVSRVNGCLETFWEQQRLPDDGRMEVLLCVEEVLSNVIRHGFPGEDEDEVWVRADLAAGEIQIQIEDNGEAFDPLSYPPPRLDVPLQERRIGGLGIHLVRKLMDRIRYERSAGRNCFSMAKKIATGREP